MKKLAYVLILVVTSTSLTFGQWQTNSPSAGVNLTGVQSTGTAPAVTQACFGSAHTLNFGGTLAGAPYERALNLAAGIPAGSPGATVLGSGQVMNLALANPTTAYFTGGSTPRMTPMPGSVSIPFNAPPVVLTASIQLFAIDFTSPDFLRLSQCATFVTSGVGASVAGPTTDDGFASVAIDPCWGCSSVSFFGAGTYSTLVVNSNGRVSFGAGSTDFSPTVAEALTGAPFIGFWTDLNPSLGGNITVGPGVAPNGSSSAIVVHYDNIRYYNSTTPVNFKVIYDCAASAWFITGLATSPPNPLTGNAQFLGLSVGGGAGATNPGSQTILGNGGIPGTVVSGLTSSSMLYEFSTGNVSGLGGGGPNNIRFTGSGASSVGIQVF